jgi:hypothetical protein
VKAPVFSSDRVSGGFATAASQWRPLVRGAPDAAARCRRHRDAAEFLIRLPDHFSEPDEELEIA